MSFNFSIHKLRLTNYEEEFEIIEIKYEIKSKNKCTISQILDNKFINVKMINEQVIEVYDILKEDYLKNYTKTTIKAQNVIYQISSIEEEKSNQDLNISSVNLGEFEAILKEKY